MKANKLIEKLNVSCIVEANGKVLPTRNTVDGFWGTMSMIHVSGNYIQVEKLWNAASKELVDKYGLSPEEARDYLDSNDGGEELGQSLTSSSTDLLNDALLLEISKELKFAKSEIEGREWNSKHRYR